MWKSQFFLEKVCRYRASRDLGSSEYPSESDSWLASSSRSPRKESEENEQGEKGKKEDPFLQLVFEEMQKVIDKSANRSKNARERYESVDSNAQAYMRNSFVG